MKTTSLHLLVLLWCSQVHGEWISTDITQNLVMFKEKGILLPSVSYGHLVLDLKLDRMERYLRNLVSVVRQSNSTHLQEAVKLLNSRYHALHELWFDSNYAYSQDNWEHGHEFTKAQVINLADRTDDHLDSFTRPPPILNPQNREKRNALSRPKRQLFLAIGIIVSLFFSSTALLSISMQSHTDNKVVHYLQRHETQTAIHSRSIALLKNATRETEALLTTVTSDLNAMKIELAVLQTLYLANIELENLCNSLQLASNGKLSPYLLKEGALHSAFRKMQVDLGELDLETQVNELDLLRLDVSAIGFKSNRTVRLFVHVPFYHKERIFKLYEFLPMNIPLNGTKLSISINDKGYIATSRHDQVNKRVFKTLNDLSSCTKFARNKGEYYYCHDASPILKNQTDSCLMSIFARNYRGISWSCNLKAHTKALSIGQLTANSYIIFLSHKEYIVRNCPNKPLEEHEVKGLALIKVEPGCEVSAPSFSFTYSYSEFYDVPGYIRPTLNVSKIFSELNMIDSSKFLETKLDLIGSSQGLQIRDLAKEFANRHNTLWIYSLTGGISLLITIISFLIFGLATRRAFKRCKKNSDRNRCRKNYEENKKLIYPILELRNLRPNGSNPVPTAPMDD